MTIEAEPRLDPALIERGVLAMPMAVTLGLSFHDVGDGRAEVAIPLRDEVTFRPGQAQATAVFAVADFAAVAAAATTLPAGWTNATVDTTLKLVAPAAGERLVGRGRVVEATRWTTVCASDVYAVTGDREVLCATMLATARNLPPR